MKNFTFFFLAIFYISIAPTCNCSNDYCEVNYHFQLPLSLTPQIDTFKIGDTIWISSEFSNEILELNTGERITLNEFDFHSELTFEKISETPFENANLEFTVIEELGSLSFISLVGTSSFRMNYLFENERYKCKFGFVPTNEGLFEFILFSLLPEGASEGIISSPDCKVNIEQVSHLLNDGENNNYEFIQMAADSLIRTTSKEDFDMYGSYCFYVVE